MVPPFYGSGFPLPFPYPWFPRSGYLPRLASYVCMYSEVINCETRAVLPTPESPNMTTRYLCERESLECFIFNVTHTQKE